MKNVPEYITLLEILLPPGNFRIHVGKKILSYHQYIYIFFTKVDSIGIRVTRFTL